MNALIAWLSQPLPPDCTVGVLLFLVLLWGACGIYIGSVMTPRQQRDDAR